MAYTYAGQWGSEAIIKAGSSGGASILPLTQVYVRNIDLSLADLWTDRTKTVAAANPALTDTYGNLTFYADPGPYLVSAVIGGVEQAGQRVQVAIDPAEAAQDSEVATAVAAEAALRAAADALLIPLAQRAAANGVATLGADSKVPSAQLPDVAISDFLGVVGSQAAMLALTGEQGDWAIRSDLSTTWIIVGSDPTQLADWQELATPVDAVSSVNGRTGTVVGLAEAADTVAKALFDANTVLAADADNTPAAVTMAASTILARLAAGNIKAATPAEIKTLLAITEADVSGLVSDLAGKVAASTFDANSILKADVDNTPIVLAMGASTILARLAAGGIVAATPAELKTLLAIAESDVTNLVTDLSNKASVSDLSSEIAARQTGDYTIVPNNQTTDYTLVLADMGKVVEINAATPKTVTIPTAVSAAFPVNTIIQVQQLGAGAVTVAPAGGVTLTGATLVTAGIGSSVFLRKTATNTWVAGVSSSGATVAIGVALSDETTAITTGTAKATIRAPFAVTLTSVRATLSTVSSSGLPTVDINVTGTGTILSTKLTVDANELTSTTAATAPVISSAAIADDAEITFDIDVAGTGAKGLKVWLIGTKP